MDVSVIIVNYNTCQMTVNCINSIFEKTLGLDFEVILIDNASTDDSKKQFEQDSRIRYIYSFENMGFGRANNVGMMLAHGEYILLLNNDTLLLNNAIKSFVDFSKCHCKDAFYGCWLQNEGGNFIHSCAQIPTVRSRLISALNSYRHRFNKKYEFFPENIQYSSKEIKEVGYITGADLFFHRSIYEKTGGFDHRFFMYYEESDWQLRAQKIGIKAFCVNGPQIIHFEGGSQKKTSSGWNINKFRYSMQSQCFYIKKNYGKVKYFIFRFCYALLYMPIMILGKHNTIKEKIQLLQILLSYNKII